MSVFPWRLEVRCNNCGRVFVVKKKDVEATMFDDHYYCVCRKCHNKVFINIDNLTLDVIEDADRRYMH